MCVYILPRRVSVPFADCQQYASLDCAVIEATKSNSERMKDGVGGQLWEMRRCSTFCALHTSRYIESVRNVYKLASQDPLECLSRHKFQIVLTLM